MRPSDEIARRLGPFLVEITREETVWLNYAARAGMSLCAELALILRERNQPLRRSPVIVVRRSSR